MEPIYLLVGAIVAGSAAALKETANQAVKDVYLGLKTAIIYKWKKGVGSNEEKLEQEATILLESLESDPETFLTPFKKKLSVAIPNPSEDLINQALKLQELIDEEGFKQGKYEVVLNNCKGVQVGNDNTQINNFK